MNTILRVFFTVCLFAATASLFAQDNIILKNRNEIKAIVLEIETETVKYKKFENSSGPTYTVLKSEVFMIKYENGEKDVFENEIIENKSDASNNQVKILDIKGSSSWSGRPNIVDSNGNKMDKEKTRMILAQVPEALSTYNSGVTMKTISDIFFGVSTGCIIIGLLSYDYDTGTDNNNSWAAYGVGLAFGIGELVLNSAGNSKIKSSVNIYNNSIQSGNHKSDMSLNFGLTKSGGVGLTFNF